ncbi:MAG: hypothetical protein KTR16_04925 [Acidiferrobacterales bacterium]|nr:hypothetical protein [Acidiferrobacterales bacterium]
MSIFFNVKSHTISKYKIFLLILFFLPLISLARTIEVTAQIGEPGCDLVEAINAANRDFAGGGCPAGDGDDLILLNFSVQISEFIVSTVNNTNEEILAPDNGANGLPRITTNIRILARGMELVTIKRSDAVGTPDFRLFTIENTGSLTIENISLQNGKTSRPATGTSRGGAVFSTGGEFTALDSEFRNNSSLAGGALAVQTSQSIILRNSLFVDNIAPNISVDGTTFLGTGGAIYASPSIMEIYDSTFSGNQADGRGGAIDITGGGSNVSIINTTISNNSAGGSESFGVGGGISFGKSFDPDYSSNLRIINSIISGNSVVGFNNTGNEIARPDLEPFDTVYIENSLIGHSGLSTSEALQDVTDLTNSILATSDGNRPTALTDIILPLNNNGGSTLTHALPLNSPAIDAAIDGTPFTAFIFELYAPGCRGEEISPATPLPDYRPDQRGVARPNGSACDIGAFELEQNESCFVIKASNENVVVFCL